MGTPFNIVINEAMTTITDYKLDKLYETNQEAFDKVMIGYMVKNLFRFTECVKSLNYNYEEQMFEEKLDADEIGIIAEWTVIAWYEDNLNDVLEFKEALQDKEFKKFSTGQNLVPRQRYLKELYTRVKLDTSDYMWNHWDTLSFFGK